MHAEVLDFIERMRNQFPDAFKVKTVLEAGSMDMNGSPRKFFLQAEKYIGVDWRPGPRVDVVTVFHAYLPPPQDPQEFDFCISAEMLEHDLFWELSLSRLIDLCAPRGSVLVTAAGFGRPPHSVDCAIDGAYYKTIWSPDLLGMVGMKLRSSNRFRRIILEDDPDHMDVRLFLYSKF
jgi:hypothetical protein